ncbi:outer membrane lipoprotein-sorting protein [Spectribacter hydrogenoxidans]|uniref:Outer membrane lipoprotein-sorting protein n=1 Tax=Spectribacter hydrogenoxidans TaxID=3075608 RepID=A0ABU3BZB1_9GAMM|nr:outer membrane lipoprotein-sorting protein [Salinisphaera sp. W335]MDT0634647.1 outer membrane lipoprotein-sorting protein [Salinisphaera sp. W335]
MRWFIVIAVLFPLGAALAEEGRGMQIARDAEARFADYADQRGEATMVIRTADGDEARRELRARSMETDDGSRSLTIIQHPPDVAGTALLTHSHSQRPDEQWLYLPALSRVKRIAAGNRAGAFMGSEFSYADFTAQPVEKFDVTLLREDTLDGESAYVLERVPEDPDTAVYSRQVAWLDQAHYRTLRVEYFNKAGQHLKTLEASDFQEYPNGQWRAGQLTMTNQLTGGTSTLRWRDITFDNGFTRRDFSVDALERAR